MPDSVQRCLTYLVPGETVTRTSARLHKISRFCRVNVLVRDCIIYWNLVVATTAPALQVSVEYIGFSKSAYSLKFRKKQDLHLVWCHPRLQPLAVSFLHLPKTVLHRCSPWTFDGKLNLRAQPVAELPIFSIVFLVCNSRRTATTA